uniref:Fibronectin type-III domain-containing protein n=1 Tax=Amphimedon queenslandica TaxID=400682 RepID=A0A1X7VVA4_AMPQE
MIALIAAVFLLSVSEVISQCSPSSGIYLRYDNGNCYPNGSFFSDNTIRDKPLECGLPGATLNGGQWIGPNGTVPCPGSKQNVQCTPGSSGTAILSVQINHPNFLASSAGDGWYKCCLPTDCSNANNTIFANIFNFAQIDSLTADLPSDMTVYPQEYKLNCTKIGHNRYDISMSIGNTALASYTNCHDPDDNCPGTDLTGIVENTVRYTVTITWDGMTVSSGSVSQSITGDQMYQCVVQVSNQRTRTRSLTVTVPASAPSSLTEVNKTATTITVNWNALDSSDADGYVVNVTSDTDTVQTVQVEGSSNNTITLNGLRAVTNYSITVRAYQQLLGPASSTISVFTTHCQQKGIYLGANGNCYPNGSYFWDNTVKAVTEAISCVLPGTSLTTGQWVRVADPDDDPIDCNNNSDNDPFRCTNVTSPDAILNLYLAQGLPAEQEGWYKCCLPTDCLTASNIMFANIFRFVQIASFYVDIPSSIVLPQEYTIHCIKTGYAYGYDFKLKLDDIQLINNAGCTSSSPCNNSYLLHKNNHTYDHTVNVTWDGMTVSSGSISQSITGDQMYQCRVADHPDANAIRIRNVTIKAPATAPSSLTEVSKTATTITVSWTALDSSDADGYVVNVTSDTDTVQTVQVEGSSNNTITLNGLRELTTYNITVRTYQQLLGPASSAISVLTPRCQVKGIYLAYIGYCYPNKSYFFDNNVNEVTKAISCVLPGTSLTTGQWVRVADPDDDPVDCNSNSASDPFRCTNVISPDAAINLYLVPNQGLADQEGWYKCCLPTDCSDPNTNIIFANIFRFSEIESFTAALPSDMTVYPQKYKLNCVKIGYQLYDGISMSIDNTVLVNYTNCDDRTNTCPGTVLVSSNPNTVRYTVDITWNGMNVSSGLISQSTTGDQMYQCVLDNPSAGADRTRILTVKVPVTAPSSLTEVSKTAITITVSWTALDSSDADGYVVNVTSDTDTVQTVQVEGSSNNTITLNGLNIETTYSITVRAYQQLLGPASSTISVQTLSTVINSINWILVSSITQLNNTQYRIDCLTTTDINPSTDVYWLVNGVMKSNSMYTSIDVLTYNNTLLVYPDPLGVSVNVTCIAMIGEVNYSQSVILHGMIIL